MYLVFHHFRISRINCTLFFQNSTNETANKIGRRTNRSDVLNWLLVFPALVKLPPNRIFRPRNYIEKSSFDIGKITIKAF